MHSMNLQHPNACCYRVVVLSTEQSMPYEQRGDEMAVYDALERAPPSV